MFGNWFENLIVYGGLLGGLVMIILGIWVLFPVGQAVLFTGLALFAIGVFGAANL
jgi:hypothetical protein